MLQSIANFAELSTVAVLLLFAVSLLAGLIRGFSGFALSAVVMASMSGIISPVELLPISFWLELLAGIFMVRGGIKNADMSSVWGLIIGFMIGIPIGLFFVTWVDVDTSKITALLIILSLASLIFLKVKAQFLATKTGTYLSGVLAGLAGGMAAVGGMVVALFVLARGRPAAEMRGSLVMFLLISLAGNAVFNTLYDIFTVVAFKRAALMAPILIGGILIGSALFNPKLEKYYKPVCLIILMAICAINLANLLIADLT